MECPHCHNQIDCKRCPACGAEVPLEGQYCMHCGAPMEEAASGSEGTDRIDFDDRVLCPDGTCTGIIVEGTCSECGRPFEDGAETG